MKKRTYTFQHLDLQSILDAHNRGEQQSILVCQLQILQKALQELESQPRNPQASQEAHYGSVGIHPNLMQPH